MNPSIPVPREATLRPTPGAALSVHDQPAPASAVSWSAIVAGAVGAAALSLILLILGTGLGLSSVSPFSGQGAGATAFGVSTILWLTFTQLAASGMGGYLAGRLRSRWVATQADEVYFRDTAHGFLAWAVASLVAAAMLSSAIGSIVGNGVQAGASVAAGTAATATAAAGAVASGQGDAKDGSASNGMDYFVDSLFRKSAGTTTTPPAAPGDDASASRSATEVARIFANAVRTGSLSPDDTRYVGQLISQRTGLAQADAEKRATDTFAKLQANLREAEAKAREAADKARKTSAYAALWLFVSLLIGAFVASLAATFGGRQRDL
jgi:hypothetical protein